MKRIFCILLVLCLLPVLVCADETGNEGEPVSTEPDSGSIHLGSGKGFKEFSISTFPGYVYYTEDSDLEAAGLSTSAGYLFGYDPTFVCYVQAAGGGSAFINWYPTEGNAALSVPEKIQLCMDLGFGKEGEFWNHPFRIIPKEAAYGFYQDYETKAGQIYFAYIFVILNNGVVQIASNGDDAAQVAGTVEDLYYGVLRHRNNSPVE